MVVDCIDSEESNDGVEEKYRKEGKIGYKRRDGDKGAEGNDEEWGDGEGMEDDGEKGGDKEKVNEPERIDTVDLENDDGESSCKKLKVIF